MSGTGAGLQASPQNDTESSSAHSLPAATTEAMQAKINETGFGPYQMLCLLCCGGVFLAEGAQVMIMGCFSLAVEDPSDGYVVARVFLLPIVFVGCALGGLLSGYIGDRLGRRTSILVSYMLTSLASLLCFATHSNLGLLMVRLLTGVGFGVGFCSSVVLIPEVCPMHMRGAALAAVMIFLPIGHLYSTLVVKAVAEQSLGPDLPWSGGIHVHKLLQYEALPSLLFLIFSAGFLWESPHWLLSRGRVKEMSECLSRMALMNGRSGIDTSFADSEESSVGAEFLAASSPTEVPLPLDHGKILGRLAQAPHARTLSVLILAHFVKDFAMFGLGVYLPLHSEWMFGLEMDVWRKLSGAAFFTVPGVALAMLLAKTSLFGHIRCVALTAVACGAASVSLLGVTGVHPCFLVVQCMAMGCYIIILVYTAEVFPTKIRNSALGICVSSGRAAPLVLELWRRGRSLNNNFWCALIALMFSLSLAALIGLRQETKGQLLQEDDIRPKDPGHGSAYSTFA